MQWRVHVNFEEQILARLIKLMILLGVIGVFVLSVGLGFLLIISGGDPISFVRTSLIQLSLAGRQEELAQPAGTDTTDRLIQIELGDTPAIIAQKLAANGLILDQQLFVDYVRAEGLDTQLDAGYFFLNQTRAIPEIATFLTDAANGSILFQLQPGMRLEEVITAVDNTPRLPFSGDDFSAVVGAGAQIDPELATLLGIPVGSSLEGFMFPDAYLLSPNTTALELRDAILSRFVEVVGTQIIIDANAQGLSVRDVVIVASIAEREAVWDDEFPLITSAYRNRLDIGMKLDADPTVQYALNGGRGRWWPNITPADYRGVVSPYNTYLNNGLPPGPISSPSLAAIRAATYPAESSYLFFRARCDGSNYHAFATTYDEHLANGC